MKLTDPVDIMLDCSLPDKKKLLGILGAMTPGATVRVKIDNNVACKALIEGYVKNQWCRIVKAEDGEDFSILHIRRNGEV